MKIITIILLTILICFQTTLTQDSNSPEEDIESSIKTAADVFKMLEDSELTYVFDLMDTTKQYEPFEQKIVNEYYFVDTSDGRRTLYLYNINDSSYAHFETAKTAFGDRDFKRSLSEYQSALYFDSSYHLLYTLIADVFYVLDQYDSAKFYFEQALDLNFYNFQTHWFYADLMWKMGDTTKCLDHITIAHLLNINHVNAYNILRTYRFETGNEWKDWSFSPNYKIYEDSGKVIIEFDPRKPEFMSYVITKALWRYEPGYAKNRLGYEYNSKDGNSNFEEREAVIAYLTTTDSTNQYYKIASDGYIEEFIIYEIMAPQQPELLYLLDEEQFYRIKEYIEKYH